MIAKNSLTWTHQLSITMKMKKNNFPEWYAYGFGVFCVDDMCGFLLIFCYYNNMCLFLFSQPLKSKKSKKSKGSRVGENNNIGDIGEFRDKRDKALSSISTAGLFPGVPAGLLDMMPRDAFDEDNDFEEDGFEEGAPGGRVRRGVPDERMEEEDENMFEAVSRKKKQFADLKKEHYTPAARTGGLDDSLLKGQEKRAASYEIIKNKGLTPHRKKLNRNPRAKKREAYHKAVIARKGQVRDVIVGGAGGYGGESTGIKANLARSRKISN